jgi:hypothetical protein
MLGRIPLTRQARATVLRLSGCVALEHGLSAAPGPIRWHYRRLMTSLVYQSIVD